MVEFKFSVDYGLSKAGSTKMIPIELAKRYVRFGFGEVINSESKEEEKVNTKTKSK